VRRYLIRRLLQFIPVLLGIALVTFVIVRLAPGDPASLLVDVTVLSREELERFRRELGLEAALPEQFMRMVGELATGQLRSFRTGQPVLAIVAERLPATGRLALAATAIAVVVGLAAGIAAALRPGGLLDQLLMSAAVLGISTPVFWLGMMLSLLFAVWLGWLPVSGYGDGAWANLVLPAVTLGALHTGTIARMARSSLLEVIRQEYIQTARAKGLTESRVVAKHALRNALIPVVTVIGIGLADLLVGAPLTETVFAWPGLGRMLVTAVGQRDLPVVMGAVLIFAVIYVLANLLVDLAYLVIDPRIRRAP